MNPNGITPQPQQPIEPTPIPQSAPVQPVVSPAPAQPLAQSISPGQPIAMPSVPTAAQPQPVVVAMPDAVAQTQQVPTVSMQPQIPQAPGLPQQPVQSQVYQQVAPPQVVAPTPQQTVVGTPGQVAAMTPAEAEAQSLVISKLHSVEKPAEWAIVVFVVAISIFSLVGAGHVLSVRHKNYNKLPYVKAENAQKTLGKDVQAPVKGELDLSKKVNGSYAVKSQSIKASLNQQINFSDGLSFMITDAQYDWKSIAKYSAKPKAGNQFVKLTVAIGNRNTTSQLFFGAFSAKAADGTFINNVTNYVSDYDFSDGTKILGIDDKQLDPGERSKGVMMVEVPVGTTSVSMVRDAYAVVREEGSYGSKVASIKMQAEVTLK